MYNSLLDFPDVLVLWLPLSYELMITIDNDLITYADNYKIGN